jgi:hypothetical protein
MSHRASRALIRSAHRPAKRTSNVSETETDYLWNLRHRTLYDVELSALYHRKRERFFGFLDRTTKAVAIIGGSAAFAAVGGPDALKWAGLAVAGTSTLALVFGFAERARDNAELAQRFLTLQADIVRAGERDFTEDQIRDWSAQRLLIETAEPPALGALVIECQNELASVRDGQRYRIPWFARLLRHFKDYHGHPMPHPSGT